MATRSQYSASSMKCVVTITVTPCSASPVIRRQNSRRASGSAPLVGSSRNSDVRLVQQRRGHRQPLLESAGQLAARQRARTARARTAASPSRCARACARRAGRTRWRRNPGSRPPKAGRRARTSAPRSRSAAGRRPSRGAGPRPATRNVPPLAGSSPHSIRKVVVLPAPFGPEQPENFARRTSKLMWSTAVKSPNRRDRSWTSTTISPSGFRAEIRAGDETGVCGRSDVAPQKHHEPVLETRRRRGDPGPGQGADGGDGGALGLKHRTRPLRGTASRTAASPSNRAWRPRAACPACGSTRNTLSFASALTSAGAPSARTFP